jgi:hypothetical protein
MMTKPFTAVQPARNRLIWHQEPREFDAGGDDEPENELVFIRGFLILATDPLDKAFALTNA